MTTDIVNDQYGQAPSVNLTDPLQAKPFYKIGEVAKLLDVKPHVLRYWESEFPTLKPKKKPSGQRIYAREDIETLVEIQYLLYNERYTIAGARQMLAKQPVHSPPGTAITESVPQALADLKKHVSELLAMLD